MHQPKWYKTDEYLKEGDVVLFLKNDSSVESTYQYRMVKSTEPSEDGVIRKVRVKYRNHNEKVDRVTFRSVRQLVVIHRQDELDLTEELHNACTLANSVIRKYNGSEAS